MNSEKNPEANGVQKTSSYEVRQILGKKHMINEIMHILVDGKAHKAASLAFELGIRTRTVRRYVHFMQDQLRVPIIATRKGFQLAADAVNDSLHTGASCSA